MNVSAHPLAVRTDWETAWAHALNTLELDVARAEELLADRTRVPDSIDRISWAPPQLAGPLPESMRARAQAIMDRQLRVAEGLTRAVAAARAELRAVERMQTSTVDRSVPAFFDSSM